MLSLAVTLDCLRLESCFRNVSVDRVHSCPDLRKCLQVLLLAQPGFYLDTTRGGKRKDRNVGMASR